jgi:protein phosphatase
MGTTVTLGLRIGQNLYIGHVGDSRAYLIRNRNIMQLTEDHSVVASLVKERVITSDEAKTHPDRGKIFRCLGNAPSVSVDKLKEGKLQLQAGDVLILCTDGLVSNVSDDELLSVVTKEAAAHESCSQLISLANERGGDDNITAIVIKVDITKLGG